MRGGSSVIEGCESLNKLAAGHMLEMLVCASERYSHQQFKFVLLFTKMLGGQGCSLKSLCVNDTILTVLLEEINELKCAG